MLAGKMKYSYIYIHSLAPHNCNLVRIYVYYMLCKSEVYLFLIFYPQEEVSINTTAYEVQFIPSLVNARIANPAWDGNMPLSSLESAPVLSVVGDTSVMVRKM